MFHCVCLGPAVQGGSLTREHWRKAWGSEEAGLGYLGKSEPMRGKNNAKSLKWDQVQCDPETATRPGRKSMNLMAEDLGALCSCSRSE